MLVGSQVSLKYDLDLSLTQVPENLIFYSDEQMTTAFLKENGTIHLDGTFLANDNNKTASRTIYWAWPIETGSTQTEINHNDELDSEWVGSDVIVGINATGKQIMGDPNEEYTVTFDLNGGTLANHGDTEQITKQITYGEAYGDLPVPTREGYEFKGWNGKNMFDEDGKLLAINGATYNDGYYVFDVWGAHSMYDGGILSSIKENTQYTISICGHAQAKNVGTLFIGFKYTDGTQSRIYINTDEEQNQKITSSINKIIDKVYMSYGYEGDFYVKYIQIEEGTSATEYEPYILSTSTPVTQNKNHTLTAIWEPVSNNP